MNFGHWKNFQFPTFLRLRLDNRLSRLDKQLSSLDKRLSTLGLLVLLKNKIFKALGSFRTIFELDSQVTFVIDSKILTTCCWLMMYGGEAKEAIKTFLTFSYNYLFNMYIRVCIVMNIDLHSFERNLDQELYHNTGQQSS